MRRPAIPLPTFLRPLRAALTLPLAALLCACAIGGSMSFDTDPPQPFPVNYRSEIPAFLRTYLNNPSGLRDAAMAEPVQRPVDGRVRWLSCLRFTRAAARCRTWRSCMSTAGSTASRRTPASCAPASFMRRFPSWKNCRADPDRIAICRD